MIRLRSVSTLLISFAVAAFAVWLGASDLGGARVFVGAAPQGLTAQPPSADGAPPQRGL